MTVRLPARLCRQQCGHDHAARDREQNPGVGRPRGLRVVARADAAGDDDAFEAE